MKLVVTGLVLALISGVSFAETIKSKRIHSKTAQKKVISHSQVFKVLDANQNGVLTMNEVEGQDILLTAFPKLDANTDGTLSVIEFSRFANLKELVKVSSVETKKETM